MKDEKFKILALDGGGIRGLYTSIILEKIEQSFNIKLNECFDLLIGTSTGAILSSAIALKIPIKEISKLYEENGLEIFKKRKFYTGFFRSKYKSEKLEKALEAKFKDTTLGKIDKPLMIVSSDLLNDDVYIHKSNYLSKIEPYNRDGSTKLTKAILSSCAAPVYFDPVRLDNDYLLCDGGLWANNPSILGLTEAISKFKKSIDEISILSVSTGNNTISYKKKKNNWGVLTGWGHTKLIKYLLSLSAAGATNISNLLLGKNYTRIDSNLDYDIDDIENLDNLRAYASKCFFDSRNEIENFFKIK